MFPPDTYENLSRGVIDATQMGFVPTVNLKWYEAAKYYMFDGTYAAGNAFGQPGFLGQIDVRDAASSWRPPKTRKPLASSSTRRH